MRIPKGRPKTLYQELKAGISVEFSIVSKESRRKVEPLIQSKNLFPRRNTIPSVALTNLIWTFCVLNLRYPQRKILFCYHIHVRITKLLLKYLRIEMKKYQDCYNIFFIIKNRFILGGSLAISQTSQWINEQFIYVYWPNAIRAS